MKVKLNIDFREILGESKGLWGQMYLHFHILVSQSYSRKYLFVWYFKNPFDKYIYATRENTWN